MYKGGCLCGAIRYEISGRIRNIVFCHCSRCRKAQGSAFATNGIVETADFKLIQGEGELQEYESEPGSRRYFCRICGSPIMSRRDNDPDRLRVRVGTVETAIEERPMAHIFATSKADWEQITDELPQYEEYEPGRN